MDYIATKDAICDELVALAEADKNVYVIDTDVLRDCKTNPFLQVTPSGPVFEKFPGQHINVGLAEQNAISIAAGIATTGKIPFIVTRAQTSLHALEQIKQSICYTNLNVKILCINSGLTAGTDGSLGHSNDDVGVLRGVPNLVIANPTDYNSSLKLIEQAYLHQGPVYMRFSNEKIANVYLPDEEFELGKAMLIKTGFDICIMTTGDTFAKAKIAADKLEEDGVLVSLLDIPTIKPLDTDTIMQQIDNTSNIITVEDHNITNGLGTAICELVAEIGKGKVRRIGVRDNFGETGSYEELLELNGITVDNIVKTANEMLGRLL